MFLSLFQTANSPRRLALSEQAFEPHSQLAYVVFSAGASVAVFSQSQRWRLAGCVLSLFTAAVWLDYRRLLSNVYIHFCDMCLRGDLNDIPSYYHMRPADREAVGELETTSARAFWVAELKRPGLQDEIIACVGFGTFHFSFFFSFFLFFSYSSHTTPITTMYTLDLAQREDGQPEGSLIRMAVSPFHRRRGIARMLVEMAIARAREYNLPSIKLTTSMYQRSAIILYLKFGWVHVRTWKLPEGWMALPIFDYTLDLTK